MRNITSLLLIMIIAVSCAKHEDGIDWTLQTGNIYCASGRIVPRDAYVDDMGGIGVIAVVGGEDDDFRIIAVGRYDAGDHIWADSLVSVRNVSSDRVASNGSQNTAAMISEALEGKITMEAAEACLAYSDGRVSGWHLPSCGELMHAAVAISEINKSLRLIQGEQLRVDGWYLSSTQDGSSSENEQIYALTVSMHGNVRSTVKTLPCTCRPFIQVR